MRRKRFVREQYKLHERSDDLWFGPLFLESVWRRSSLESFDHSISTGWILGWGPQTLFLWEGKLLTVQCSLQSCLQISHSSVVFSGECNCLSCLTGRRWFKTCIRGMGQVEGEVAGITLVLVSEDWFESAILWNLVCRRKAGVRMLSWRLDCMQARERKEKKLEKRFFRRWCVALIPW